MVFLFALELLKKYDLYEYASIHSTSLRIIPFQCALSPLWSELNYHGALEVCILSLIYVGPVFGQLSFRYIWCPVMTLYMHAVLLYRYNLSFYNVPSLFQFACPP